MTAIFIVLLTIIFMHILVEYFIQFCKKEEPEEQPEVENQHPQESQGIKSQNIQEIHIIVNQEVDSQLQIESTDDLQKQIENEDVHHVENQEAQTSQGMEYQNIHEPQTRRCEEVNSNDEREEPVENQEDEEPQDHQNPNRAENLENDKTEYYVVNLPLIFAMFVVILFLMLGYYFSTFSSRLSLFLEDSVPLVISVLFVLYYYSYNPLLRQYVWQKIMRHSSSVHPQNNQEELEDNLELGIQNWDEIEMESF